MQEIHMSGSDGGKNKSFAQRWVEHPFWGKMESFLDKAEGITRVERVERNTEARLASIDKERMDILRGGRTSLFDGPKPGVMEGFLRSEEIAQLSDKELLALDDRLTSEMCNENPRITPNTLRQWADEITGGKLKERLEAEMEQRREMEEEKDSDWLDRHLGNRGG
jgi:hypothetical protein